MSIGDSTVEQQAAKECLSAWGRFQPLALRPICQTVKMIDQPSLHALSDELRFLTPHLSSLSHRDQDFDLCLDGCINVSNFAAAAATVLPGTALNGVPRAW